MFYLAYYTKEDPVMTMGDAIASFLKEKDMTTEQFPLLSVHGCEEGYSAGATTWNDVRYRWRDTTSQSRFMVTAVLQVLLHILAPRHPC